MVLTIKPMSDEGDDTVKQARNSDVSAFDFLKEITIIPIEYASPFPSS